MIKNDFELLKDFMLEKESEHIKQLDHKCHLYFKRVIFGFISQHKLFNFYLNKDISQFIEDYKMLFQRYIKEFDEI